MVLDVGLVNAVGRHFSVHITTNYLRSHVRVSKKILYVFERLKYFLSFFLSITLIFPCGIITNLTHRIIMKNLFLTANTANRLSILKQPLIIVYQDFILY